MREKMSSLGGYSYTCGGVRYIGGIRFSKNLGGCAGIVLLVY